MLKSIATPFGSVNDSLLDALVTVSILDGADVSPTAGDRAWWAAESASARRICGGIEAHVPFCPPGDGWNVAYRPDLAGKPMIPGPSRGPWVVIAPDDTAHSGHATAAAAREALLDARAGVIH